MPRIPTSALRCLLAALLLLPACSRRAERLVGNERLIRGPGGTGVTDRVVGVPDRDTWLERGTRNDGASLVVASTGSYQAVTLLRVAKWNLPVAPGDSLIHVISVILFGKSLVQGAGTSPVAIRLAEADKAWNADSVVWSSAPGPAADLGGTTEDFTADNLALPLTLAAPLDSLKKWAAAPAAEPGLLLYASGITAGSVAVYSADSLYFRFAYQFGRANQTDSIGTIDSPVTTDLYVHAPVLNSATGGETALRLGSFEDFSVALHFPIPAIPEGAAINEATLLLPIDPATDSGPFQNLGRTVDLVVRSAGADWTEGATAEADLKPVAGALFTDAAFAYLGPADSVIAIRLPVTVARDWRSSPTANFGLIISAVRGEAAPVLLIQSRESSRVPRIHFSYTSPPGGRF